MRGTHPTFTNQKYEAALRKIVVTSKPKGKLRIQCDFIKSFVFSKKNKYWIWLAIDFGPREIVGVFIGKRDKEGARGLWNSLPPVYRQTSFRVKRDHVLFVIPIFAQHIT